MARNRVASATMVRMAGSVRLQHANRFDFVIRRDLVYDVMSLAHLPEHGVNPVEVRLRRVTDEELTAPRILAGVSHGERSRLVLVDVIVCLALDGLARHSVAGASLS